MDRYKLLCEEAMNSPEKQVVKWVCDFQPKTVNEKLLRHVKPTKVLVSVTPEYLAALEEARTQSIYYMNSIQKITMKAYNRRDTITGKEISFYGNHRGDKGVHVFNNEQDCIEKYNEIVYNAIESMIEERDRLIVSANRTIEQTKELFISSDYIMEKLSRS